MVQGFSKAQSEFEAKLNDPFGNNESSPFNVDIIVKINIDNECNVQKVIELIEKINEVNSAEFIDFDD